MLTFDPGARRARIGRPGEAMGETNRLMDASVKRPDFEEGIASFVERRPPKFARVKVE